MYHRLQSDLIEHIPPGAAAVHQRAPQGLVHLAAQGRTAQLHGLGLEHLQHGPAARVQIGHGVDGAHALHARGGQHVGPGGVLPAQALADLGQILGVGHPAQLGGGPAHLGEQCRPLPPLLLLPGKRLAAAAGGLAQSRRGEGVGPLTEALAQVGAPNPVDLLLGGGAAQLLRAPAQDVQQVLVGEATVESRARLLGEGEGGADLRGKVRIGGRLSGVLLRQPGQPRPAAAQLAFT